MNLQNALKKQTAFTLIELMITITILTLLLFMGSTLTRSWIDRSQVTSALSTLKNSITKAKVAALRNSDNQPLSNPAATVCVDNTTHQINVVRALIHSTNSCDISSANNKLLHSLPIAEGILIKQGSTQVDCLSFNSAGILLTTASCSANTNLTFTVEKNDETADINII